MPIPKKTKTETDSGFMSRCIADKVMRKEYPDVKQRIAVCMQSKKTKKKSK